MYRLGLNLDEAISVTGHHQAEILRFKQSCMLQGSQPHSLQKIHVVDRVIPPAHYRLTAAWMLSVGCFLRCIVTRPDTVQGCLKHKCQLQYCKYVDVCLHLVLCARIVHDVG